MRPVFGNATWDAVELQHLVGYLDQRTAKTQGNREMALLSLVWNKARMWGLTGLPYPAAGMERSRWKNPEPPRAVEVTDDLFAAVYAEADQLLGDCMDLATATGLRLTDCRTVALPRGDVLSVNASKTGKRSDFDVTGSPVLLRLVERRRAMTNVLHTMLLTTESGGTVSARTLRDRWEVAREKAAAKAHEAGHGDFAEAVRGLYLRDMRKRASNLAESDEAARELLDHSTVGLTKKHYRTVVKMKRTVR
ncbi:MAG: integrase [Methylibium sp.]|nr:integrase [Methylibium sp.]